MASKTILITGSSRGIGRATAILAARAGYRVCVNYLEQEQAALEVVRHIEQNGGRAKAYQGNMAVEKDVQAVFQNVLTDHDALDALVNNVGILATQTRFDQISSARFQHIMLTNTMSCFLGCREAVRHMSTAKGGNGGAIVNVSSVGALTGSPNEYVDYAASKGAIDSLTIGLSKEVAAEGIRVNGVRPGFIYTDIHAMGGEPDRVDRLKDQIPMKRGGMPEEVAQSILWLLSEESSYITGSILHVAGGR
jgi:NAD(P)-dependent dehydrogenase (short-subunit alcohol dehydrogenase family)